MNKRNLLCSICLSAAIIATSISLITESFQKISSEEKTYCLNLAKPLNFDENGMAVIKNERENLLSFQTTGTNSLDSVVDLTGNKRIKNYSKINGIKSIKVNYTGLGLGITTSSIDIDLTKHQLYKPFWNGSTLFFDDPVNYFCLEGNVDTKITNLEITYRCRDDDGKGDIRRISDFSNEKFINYYGRNYISERKATFLNSNSGFEVSFTGTKLDAVINLRYPGSENDQTLMGIDKCKIRVYLDGDKTLDNSKIIELTSNTNNTTITLCEFANEGTHTVLVRKANYEERGYIELVKLGGEGVTCFNQAPPKSTRKFVIYGDSITVGCGVNYTSTETTTGYFDTSDKEDSTKSYAPMIADFYNAEVQEMCLTGISMIIPKWRDYTWNDRYYQNSYYDVGSSYDFSKYAPQIAIVNLGTNDSAGYYDPANPYYMQDWAMYSGVINMTSKIKNSFGKNTIILFCYGMMGTCQPLSDRMNMTVNCIRGIASQADQAVFDAAYPNLRFQDVFYLNLNKVECALDQTGGHPTYNGQVDGFHQIAEFMVGMNFYEVDKKMPWKL